MLVDTIGTEVPRFFEAVRAARVEIYNEFSLQHELGAHLRQALPPEIKVQFERPVDYFQPRDSRYVKKEIDIAAFTPDQQERVAVELKYPRNGQHPEQMFSACLDVVFLEQLVAGGFTHGFFVIAVEDALFLSGPRVDGIYAYFRAGQPISGSISKPTGGGGRTVSVRGSHPLQWKAVANDLHYGVVSVSGVAG
jgi:hypothetical protein